MPNTKKRTTKAVGPFAHGFAGRMFLTKGEMQQAAAKAIQNAMRSKSLRSRNLKQYKGNLYLKGGPRKKGGMYHRYK